MAFGYSSGGSIPSEADDGDALVALRFGFAGEGLGPSIGSGEWLACGSSLMSTGDHNIIVTAWSVQYNAASPPDLTMNPGGEDGVPWDGFGAQCIIVSVPGVDAEDLVGYSARDLSGDPIVLAFGELTIPSGGIGIIAVANWNATTWVDPSGFENRMTQGWTEIAAWVRSTPGAIAPTVTTEGGSDYAAGLFLVFGPGAGGAETIDPSGIASGEAHGSQTVSGSGSASVSPSSVPSAEAHGSQTLAGTGSAGVSPGSVPSAEAHGSQAVAPSGTAPVSPGGVPSAEGFGGAALASSGAAQLSPAGTPSAEAFGVAQLAPGGVDISPGAIGSEEAFGGAALSGSDGLISPSSVPSGEAHGAQSLAPSWAAGVAPSGAGSQEAFGSAVLTGDSALIQSIGISSSEQLGNSVLAPSGSAPLAPSGAPSAELFGSPSLVPGASAVSPGAIPSAEAFGGPVLARSGEQSIAPTGTASAEAFGVQALASGEGSIVASGVPSAEGFGGPLLTPSDMALAPSSIASAEEFGTALLVGLSTILASSIPSAEALGAALLAATGGVSVLPGGVGSTEAFGAHVLTPGAMSLGPDGIPSQESLGLPGVESGAAIVSPGVIESGYASGNHELRGSGFAVVFAGTIASLEAFGLPRVIGGDLSILPSGIVSGEMFGFARISELLELAVKAIFARWGQSNDVPSWSGWAIGDIVQPMQENPPTFDIVTGHGAKLGRFKFDVCGEPGLIIRFGSISGSGCATACRIDAFASSGLTTWLELTQSSPGVSWDPRCGVLELNLSPEQEALLGESGQIQFFFVSNTGNVYPLQGKGGRLPPIFKFKKREVLS